MNLFTLSDRIIEFGGGYGDLASLIYKNNHNKPTYIIIDTPVLCKIQFFYLSSIYDGNVFLVTDENKVIKDNAINIVPLNLIDVIDFKAGAFWATYSLTETNFNVLDLVCKANFFGSEHYFFAYENPSSLWPEGPKIADKLRSNLHLLNHSNNFQNGNYLYL